MSMNTTKIMIAMLKNQDLLRYVHYLGNYDPLDKNLEDVGMATVKNNNFVLTLFNPEILVETKAMLFLNPYNVRFGRGTTANDKFLLDIVLPYKYWIIEETSELRVYSIAYQIAKTIDQKNIAGVGNIKITDCKAFKVDNTFSGVSLIFEVENATYMG